MVTMVGSLVYNGIFLTNRQYIVSLSLKKLILQRTDCRRWQNPGPPAVQGSTVAIRLQRQSNDDNDDNDDKFHCVSDRKTMLSIPCTVTATTRDKQTYGIADGLYDYALCSVDNRYLTDLTRQSYLHRRVRWHSHQFHHRCNHIHL